MNATRRQVLASAALPLLVRPAGADAAAVTVARQKLVRRSRAVAVSADGRRVVVAHDLRPTIAVHGRRGVIDVGGDPVAVAVSPGGALAAVAIAAWDDKPGLALVDLASGAVRARRSLDAPCDLAFAGDHLVVIGGEQEGALHALDARTLRTIHRVAIGRVPRGLAVSRGRAWVTLQADDRVASVDLRRGQVARELAVPALPDRIALSPDGGRLLLTHADREGTEVSEVDVDRGRVHRHGAGRHPSAVAWTRSGHRLVALGGEDAVLVLARRSRRRTVAPAPRDLAVAGRRFWTVSALSAGTSAGRL